MNLNDLFNGKELDPIEAIKFAITEFSSSITIASSFSAEDMVVIDMAVKEDRSVSIFTLDTGRLPEETYELMDKVEKIYGIKILKFFPDATALERLENNKGMYSFRKSVANRIECCGIRKVEPLKRALEGKKAWLTGLRRAQSFSRGSVKQFDIDQVNGGIIKINPLINWNNKMVWEYIKVRNLPYNALYDKGFVSIGCVPCTRPISKGEDDRAGRWWWEENTTKECGLHFKDI